jgi:rRNA maturation protein Rpf1
MDFDVILVIWETTGFPPSMTFKAVKRLSVMCDLSY